MFPTLKIFSSLVPFLVVSAIALFTFAYIFYVETKDSDAYPYDPAPHISPNPYDTLLESFKVVFASFAPGPMGDNEYLLDYFFGIFIIIVLLNVVIAVVSEAWEDASEEADGAFWKYRLDLILEKTRGRRETALFACLKFAFDDDIIDVETVGTTMGEFRKRLVLAYRKKGLSFCIYVVAKSCVLIILGFPTFGVLWPKFFRQILFTPPKPKDDESKTQLGHLLEEYKSNVAEYRREVKLMRDKLDEVLSKLQ